MSLGALYKNNLAHPGQGYYQKNKEDLQAWFQACLKSNTCQQACLETARSGQKTLTLALMETKNIDPAKVTFLEDLKPQCASKDLDSFVKFMKSASESQYVPLSELRDWFTVTASSSDLYSINLLYMNPGFAGDRFCLFIQF